MSVTGMFTSLPMKGGDINSATGHEPIKPSQLFVRSKKLLQVPSKGTADYQDRVNAEHAEGIVHNERVTCPMHNWVIELSSGEATGGDCGCTDVYESKIEDDYIYLNM